MKAGIKTSIHNRFDIYCTNIETGETKQIAYAENIVLDQMWARLTARAAYFVNVHYGTGTGTLASSRTGLFTYLGTKVAVNDVLTKTIPTASWRRKIVLNPEDNVGAVLTEIGISYDATATHLVTHALLKDMNGNQVAITKTAVDVLTIYATVYITFSTSSEDVQICGLPNNNPLMNYLVGGTAVGNCYFYSGSLPRAGREDSPAVYSALVGTSAAITWTADVPNKKMTTSTPRFAVGDSNGNLAEIGFGTGQETPIFRIKLPAASIYAGLNLAEVPLGTGDASNRLFVLPSNNIKAASLIIKKDGVTVTDYTSEEYAFPERHRAAFATGNNGRSGYIIFSADETKMLCAWNIGSSPSTEGSAAYNIEDNYMVTQLTLPNTSDYNRLMTYGALSNDGKVLAKSCSLSPYLYTYDLADTTYIQRADPANLPAGIANGIALSADGSILAVAHANSPYITTYDWTGGAWIKRANPANLPAGNGEKCSLSTNGLILAVAHANSPYITTYDWTAGAWVKRADPVELPTGNSTFCSLSADGSILAVAHANSPYITSYDWTGGAWVKRANPVELPTPTVNGAMLSADGKIMVLGLSVSPFVHVYNWINNTWVKQPPLVAPIYAISTAVSISPNGKYMSLASAIRYSGQFDSYLYPLSDGAKKKAIIFDTPPANGAVITADYTVNGIHKTIQRVIDLSASFTFGVPV